MAKGFKDSKGNFHPTNNGRKSSKDKSIETGGTELLKVKEREFPLDTIIEKMEKDFAKGLKENDFTNKKLQNKDWQVGITYEGGFSEEYFSFWAQPKDESVEPITVRSFISNFDWSEGLDEDIQERIEKDSDFAGEQYDDWLVSTFELFSDNFFMELADTIEDEHR